MCVMTLQAPMSFYSIFNVDPAENVEQFNYID